MRLLAPQHYPCKQGPTLMDESRAVSSLSVTRFLAPHFQVCQPGTTNLVNGHDDLEVNGLQTLSSWLPLADVSVAETCMHIH